MKVSSTVKMDFGRIRKLTQTQITALEQTAEALHTDVVQEQVIPRDEGTLQNESTFVDYTDIKTGVAVLVSSTPYARRLYFHPEYHFSKAENPYAKGKWYEDWLPGGKYKDFCQKKYAELYKRLAGL